MLLFIGSILVKIAEDAEFQYTSCYSLSSSASCFSFLLPGFNTSHVTLYRCKGPRKCPGSLVSIHLMLLFIEKKLSDMEQKIAFQYISCYSLSFWQNQNSMQLGEVSIHLMLLFISQRMNRIIRYLSFNTSHVTLYHWRGFKRLYRWEVSIHLMLLFIVSMAKQSGIGSRFNTSHVTLYLRHGCIS